jgi:uncharacterized damage-inducible protein DinB
METMPEPWLRGPIPGVSPLLSPLLYSFQQAREDLAAHTEGLTSEQLWARGPGSMGFHLRHIAGSTERLMEYLQCRALTADQLAALSAEGDPCGPGRDELLAEIDRVFREGEAVIRGLDPATLADLRTVGRLSLPTTVIGLLTHIAEHTQRHVGQVIALSRNYRISG